MAGSASPRRDQLRCRGFEFPDALLLVAAALALAGCSDDAVPSPPATGGSGGGGGGPVAQSCDVHAGGPARFTRRSETWGLSAAAIVGNRIASGDLDGDGYPDLVIHAIGGNDRERIGSGDHRLYVLMNEEKPGGGRTFVDRTAESGYGTTPEGAGDEYRSAHLAVLGDVDNDGDTDLFSGTFTDPSKVGSPPAPADLDRSQVLLNDGQGHFTLAPPSDVQPAKAMPTVGASLRDVNHDGKVDLFIGFHHSNGVPNKPQLLVGNGDGTFTDQSLASGVGDSDHRRAAFGVTACDLDADGSTELLVSAYARGPNILFRSDAPGHWSDVGVAAGYAYDDNQVYQDNEMFKCWCTVYGSDRACAGVEEPRIVCPDPADAYWYPATDVQPARLGGNTFTTVCSDVTGDGRLDLYNAEIAHWWAGQSSDRSELLIQDGAGALHFARPGQEATGMSFPHVGVDWNEGGLMAAAADLDLDGREDVLVAASDYPDQFGLYFQQQPDGSFVEVGEDRGFHHPCTSGLTVADFDRDGDLDLVVGSGTARDCAEIWETNEVHLYESDASEHGHWAAVRLVGDGATTNRTGIGARVTVDADGVLLTKELGGGYGHMGMQNDTVLFFGLGGCSMVHAVEVVWPDPTRSSQRFENVEVDRVLEIRQGDPEVH